jgi:hypothetical protein
MKRIYSLALLFALLALALPVRPQQPTFRAQNKVAAAAVAFVQEKALGAASGTPQTVTLDALPLAGNTLVALVACSAARTVTGITGGGVTWAQSAAVIVDGKRAEIWYGHNSDGSSAAVTVSLSSGIAAAPSVNVSEWSGLADAAPTDSSTASDNTSTSDTSNGGAVTTASANALVIAVMVSAGGTYSSSVEDGFARMTPVTIASSSSALEGAYFVATAPGDYSTSVTWTTTVSWVAAVAAFGGE